MRLSALLLLAAGALAQDIDPQRDIGFDQNIGATLPLDARFRDEKGRAVRLGDLCRGRPVVLALVYYECPQLCTLVLNGIVGCLKAVSFDAGREFDVVAISIDPGETPELARRKKATYVAAYGREGAAAGWHFLVGEESEIRKVTGAAGYRYRYDPETDLYAHAAGVVVVTPDGRLSRYFYGVEYAPRDVRLALVEASEGRLGSVVDAVLLYCFHYDPATGRYGFVVMSVLRVAGAATVLVLVFFIVRALRRPAS